MPGSPAKWDKGKPREQFRGVRSFVEQRRKVMFKRVEELPIFEELYPRMKSHESSRSIARYIQASGYWCDLYPGTVRERVNEYRKWRGWYLANVVHLHANDTIKNRLKKVEKMLDELEEMESLYRVQKERINAFRETEKQMPIPIKQIDDSMRVALQMIEAYAELRMDLGQLERKPQEVHVNFDSKAVNLVEGRYGRESLQRVMADPKKRAKVAGIMEKLLTSPRLQGGVLDMLDPEAKPTVIEVVDDDDEEVRQQDIHGPAEERGE